MQNFEPQEGKDIVLTGITVEGAHKTPPENAHLIEDYPWGFQLRTQKAVWMERATKGSTKGQFRLVSATRDPKRPGNPWCAPKPGCYHDIAIPYLDGTPGETYGHVRLDAIACNQGPDSFQRFRDRWKDELTDDHKTLLVTLEKISRHYNKDSWAKHDAETNS